MGISDRIEAFICELLKDDDGWVELGRNELAGIFNCVPSQINYVIRTRFTPERGYAVESRRGGGGYLKIRRVSGTGLRQIEEIGDRITAENAEAAIGLLLECGAIDDSSARLITAAVLDDRLKEVQDADEVRSSILRAMLCEAIRI